MKHEKGLSQTATKVTCQNVLVRLRMRKQGLRFEEAVMASLENKGAAEKLGKEIFELEKQDQAAVEILVREFGQAAIDEIDNADKDEDTGNTQPEGGTQ
jgi:hypothetical protein